MDIDYTVALTFIGGVVAAAIGALAMRPLRRAQAHKNSREGEATLSEATLKWAQDIRAEFEVYKAETTAKLDAMTDKLAILQVENEIYRKHNALLTDQLLDAGLNPVPRPQYPKDYRGE